MTSFGDGLYLCAKDGKLIANVPTISTGTPTSLTNGQFLYANNGKIGSRTIPLSALTDGVIKAGDSVTTANMVMNGYITSSSTELFFEAPLGKLITAAWKAHHRCLSHAYRRNCYHPDNQWIRL